MSQETPTDSGAPMPGSHRNAKARNLIALVPPSKHSVPDESGVEERSEVQVSSSRGSHRDPMSFIPGERMRMKVDGLRVVT